MRKFSLPKSTHKAQDSSRIDLAQNLPYSYQVNVTTEINCSIQISWLTCPPLLSRVRSNPSIHMAQQWGAVSVTELREELLLEQSRDKHQMGKNHVFISLTHARMRAHTHRRNWEQSWGHDGSNRRCDWKIKIATWHGLSGRVNVSFPFFFF